MNVLWEVALVRRLIVMSGLQLKQKYVMLGQGLFHLAQRAAISRENLFAFDPIGERFFSVIISI